MCLNRIWDLGRPIPHPLSSNSSPLLQHPIYSFLFNLIIPIQYNFPINIIILVQLEINTLQRNLFKHYIGKENGLLARENEPNP